jgi:oligopeptide transport system substrate-binding protein
VDSVAVKAVNEKTLVVELKAANSAFLKKLSHPVFSPLPAAVHQSIADIFFSAEKLVGNGPFKLTELGADSFVLSKNESYWDRDKVRLAALKGFHLEGNEAWELYGRGDLDLVFGAPPELVSQVKLPEQGGLIPLLSNYYYIINTQKTPLDETGIRKALSSALDRRHLTEQVLKGGQKPAGGILPPMRTVGEVTPRQQEGLSFMPEEAQALLAKAGFSGGEGFPVLELLIREGEGHYYLASALREQWQQVLGIDVQIVALPWEELNDRLKQRNFELALQGFSADYADHSAFLEPFALGSGNNYSGWARRGLQEEIERLKTELDEAKRRELFLQAESLVLEGMPLLPIFDYTRTYAAKPWVQGLCFPAVGPLADFKKTFLE